jgi:hypothetical protein
MLVIVGLIVLLVAVIAAVLGVLGNTGPTHPLTENFSVFGYHVTGSTGALFLFGIVIGAMAMLGLSVLLAGASRTAGRGRAARRDLARSQRETAFANRDRDTLLEHQQVGYVQGAPVNPAVATTHRNEVPFFSRWLRGRQLTGTTETEGHRNEHR